MITFLILTIIVLTEQRSSTISLTRVDSALFVTSAEVESKFCKKKVPLNTHFDQRY